MGCLISIFRAGATLVLGVVIFVGFLSYLIMNNFSDKLLNADFYNDTLAAEDAYNRIYDEVLLDDELMDTTEKFLGGIEIADHQDVIDLMREVIPPEYIQSEIESAIGRTIDWVNEDTEDLELYVDLNGPLDNVKTVMLNYIDDRIDEIEVEDLGFSGCSIDTASKLVPSFISKFDKIADGVVPTSVPGLKSIDVRCRVVIFELAYNSLLDEPGLNEPAVAALENGKGDLRLPFVNGDTIEMFKVSARLLAVPLMDEAILQVRDNLTETGQFDLIKQIAEWNTDTSEALIRGDLDEGRKLVSRLNIFVGFGSMIMVIGGAVVMGLFYFPNLAGMLRWPGIALSITGGFFLVAGKIAQSKIPDALADVIETGANKASDVPLAVTDLVTDVMVSFGSQLTDGFVTPSIMMLTIGITLFGSSFLSFIPKRFIPMVK